MDEDDDGAISRSEAKGRMANFDRVDQDSSGLIDKNELSQLFKRLRAARGREAVGSNSVPASASVPDSIGTTRECRLSRRQWKLDLMLPRIMKMKRVRLFLFMVEDGRRRQGFRSVRDYPLEYASRGYVCASVNYRLIDEGTSSTVSLTASVPCDGYAAMQKSCRLMSTTLGRMGIRPVLIWWRCLVSHHAKRIGR